MGMESSRLTPEEVFPLVLLKNPEELTEEQYTELDLRLNHFFEEYEKKGFIQGSKIKGAKYISLERAVVAQFPEITAAVFNHYLKSRRGIAIEGYTSVGQSTRKVIRPGISDKPRAASPPSVSQRNKSAGDDTPDLY